MRELRQHASRWLARVAKGESLQVTDRGRPVALIVPLQEALRERLLASGEMRAGEGDLLELKPLKRSGKGLSEDLAAARAAER